jgi:chemotaxis-related protein WspD
MTAESIAHSLTRPLVHDCWNRIGIRGDRSCRELERHAHCRNCPVYSTAASTLLHVPLPSGQSQAWAEYFAQPLPAIQTAAHVAVVFRIGNEWLALPAHRCIEITEMRPIRTVPHRRHEPLLGIVNVRGALLPCVSLVTLLNLATDGPSSDPAPSASTRQRLILLSGASGAVALRSDEVEGVHRFFAEELTEGPATLTRAKAIYTKGVIRRGEKTLALLDPERLHSSIDRSLA